MYIYIYIHIYISYITYICNIRKLVVLVINKYCWSEYADELSYDVIEGTG